MIDLLWYFCTNNVIYFITIQWPVTDLLPSSPNASLYASMSDVGGKRLADCYICASLRRIRLGECISCERRAATTLARDSNCTSEFRQRALNV